MRRASAARPAASVDGVALSDGRCREVLRGRVVFRHDSYGDEARRYRGSGPSRDALVVARRVGNGHGLSGKSGAVAAPFADTRRRQRMLPDLSASPTRAGRRSGASSLRWRREGGA